MKLGVAALAAVALSTSSVAAGGLSPEINEAVVQDVIAAPPASSSTASWLIPLLIVGVIIGLASGSSGSSSSSGKDVELK